jgi:3-phenylpropionate/trans-cinnamate dioxygenase ferredoxin subunit
MEFLRVCEESEVPTAGAKGFATTRGRIALCRTGHGLVAFEDACTHDDEPLAGGTVIDGAIECPRHGARFDLASGAALCLPAIQGIEIYKLRVVDGQVEVAIDD